MGLVIVSSDLKASREFCQGRSVATFVDPGKPSEFSEAIVAYVRGTSNVCSEVDAFAANARASLSWEIECAPPIAGLLASLTGTVRRHDLASAG